MILLQISCFFSMTGLLLTIMIAEFCRTGYIPTEAELQAGVGVKRVCVVYWQESVCCLLVLDSVTSILVGVKGYVSCMHSPHSQP